MSRLMVSKLDQFQSSKVVWLWPGRVPRGKLTMLAGDPGLGKSFVTMDMAARVTRAGAWPDGPTPLREPGDVLILSAEDDPGDTIRPRIEACGGDIKRVHIVRGLLRNERELSHAGPSLDVDCAAIERTIKSLARPRLVIIDPISAYMGRADSHNNAEVRGVLGQLSEMAGRLGPAIVCVTHLSKGGQGSKAVYRTMGSLAFTAAARIVWQIAKVPDDPERRVMLLVKSNLPASATGMRFEIAQDKVQWLGTEEHLTADSIESDSASEQGQALPEAEQFLRTTLAQGPRKASEVLSEAEKVGIGLVTIRRAKRALRVSSSFMGQGKHGSWVWSLDKSTGDHGSGAEDDHL